MMQRLAMAAVKNPGAAPVACSVDITHHPMPKPVIAKLLCAPNSSQNCKVTAVQVSYMVFQYLHNF